MNLSNEIRRLAVRQGLSPKLFHCSLPASRAYCSLNLGAGRVESASEDSIPSALKTEAASEDSIPSALKTESASEDSIPSALKTESASGDSLPSALKSESATGDGRPDKRLGLHKVCCLIEIKVLEIVMKKFKVLPSFRHPQIDGGTK
jgi:hypothetical protein